MENWRIAHSGNAPSVVGLVLSSRRNDQCHWLAVRLMSVLIVPWQALAHVSGFPTSDRPASLNGLLNADRDCRGTQKYYEALFHIQVPRIGKNGQSYHEHIATYASLHFNFKFCAIAFGNSVNELLFIQRS